jgi:hypothetical protein
LKEGLDVLNGRMVVEHVPSHKKFFLLLGKFYEMTQLSRGKSHRFFTKNRFTGS